MRIADIELVETSTRCELRASVYSDTVTSPFPLWYRFPSGSSEFIDATDGSPLLAACLLPAMVAGERLEISLPVSKRLFNSIPHIQAIHKSWNPFLSPVEISCDVRVQGDHSIRRAGMFFSTGVDSFYSLIKSTMNHRFSYGAVDSLLVIDGFPEMDDRKKDIFEEVLRNTRVIADHFEKEIVLTATNIKDLMGTFGIPWMFGHGAALASVGLALGSFARIHIPSTFSYAKLYPIGTHPVLDPLWSSELTEFVHDGCEATRLEKVKFISQSQIVLDTLRPCFSTANLGFNCGRCIKCSQTMVQLHLAGALTKCKTFPNSISLDSIRSLMPLHTYQADSCRDLAEELGGSPEDEEIRIALLKAAAAGQTYSRHFETARKQISRHVPLADKFILVDIEAIRTDLGAGTRALPFLECNGQYGGSPADDVSALEEVRRLKRMGAKFMVFWRDAFWFFDAYPGLLQYLHSKCDCPVDNESVVIFNIQNEM